jgi:acetyl esterase/lipase
MIGLIVGAALLAAMPVRAEEMRGGGYEVSVTRDHVYGQGLVDVSSAGGRMRDLHMDFYRPVEAGRPLTDRPAIVMVFGGAFLRGSKGFQHFEEDGGSDSSMADYCSTFARAGYVCAAIEYRLAPEDPGVREPDPARLLPRDLLTGPAATARMEVVRQRMGLLPLDKAGRAQLWRAYLAASEDLATAVLHVRDHAADLGAAPDRIAIGGFSAGAITVVNGAYGMELPVKAAVVLSGGMGAYDIRKSARRDMPPALFFLAQNDLPGVQLGTRAALAALDDAGVMAEHAWVPGFGHFYPMGAVSLGSDMSREPVEARILDFLGRTIGGTGK